MKKIIVVLLVGLLTSFIVSSCSSSSSSPATPDKCVLQYYNYIINNDTKCLDLMAIRFVGGTDKERANMSAEFDKQIEKNNGDLSSVFFRFNGKLTKVELIPNDNGGAYTETKSRLLPDAEAAEVTVELEFENGKTQKQTNIAVKVDGEWKLY